jgi:hypothetical protein
MYASMSEAPVMQAIRALIAACYSILYRTERPVDDTVCTDGKERTSHDKEATAPKKNESHDYAADFVFLLGFICIALMLLLGLAIPAIMATGLCLLIIERRTRYRAAFAGKATPAWT